MMQEVTAKDWFKCGFTDGRDGNSKWPPQGDQETRRAYLEGYREGKEQLRKDRAGR